MDDADSTKKVFTDKLHLSTKRKKSVLAEKSRSNQAAKAICGGPASLGDSICTAKLSMQFGFIIKNGTISYLDKEMR